MQVDILKMTKGCPPASTDMWIYVYMHTHTHTLKETT